MKYHATHKNGWFIASSRFSLALENLANFEEKTDFNELAGDCALRCCAITSASVRRAGFTARGKLFTFNLKLVKKKRRERKRERDPRYERNLRRSDRSSWSRCSRADGEDDTSEAVRRPPFDCLFDDGDEAVQQQQTLDSSALDSLVGERVKRRRRHWRLGNTRQRGHGSPGPGDFAGCACRATAPGVGAQWPPHCHRERGWGQRAGGESSSGAHDVSFGQWRRGRSAPFASSLA